MGAGFTTTCPACGHNQEVMLGSGMHLPDIWEVIAQLPQPHRGRAESLLRKHPEAIFHWNRALMKCTDCHRHYNPTTAAISLGNKEIFNTVYQCPHCRQNLSEVEVADPNDEVANDFANDWACQRCGHQGLTISEHSLWD